MPSGPRQTQPAEVRQYGVRALLVEPAYTNTAFEANSVRADMPLDVYAKQREVFEQNMVDQIKATVVDLAADDWKKRDRAEAQLVSMGPVVASVLKQLSTNQPPEAQQRIESVLKQLADAKEAQ